MAIGKKILFFIDGSSPTDAERAEAERLNTTMFRNAQFVSPDECIEDFDAIAGKPPDVYKKAYALKLEKAKMAEPMKSPPPAAPPAQPPK